MQSSNFTNFTFLRIKHCQRQVWARGEHERERKCLQYARRSLDEGFGTFGKSRNKFLSRDSQIESTPVEINVSSLVPNNQNFLTDYLCRAYRNVGGEQTWTLSEEDLTEHHLLLHKFLQNNILFLYQQTIFTLDFICKAYKNEGDAQAWRLSGEG